MRSSRHYVRCSQGHVFDADKHETCPTCGEQVAVAPQLVRGGGTAERERRSTGLPSWAPLAGVAGLILLLGGGYFALRDPGGKPRSGPGPTSVAVPPQPSPTPLPSIAPASPVPAAPPATSTAPAPSQAAVTPPSPAPAAPVPSPSLAPEPRIRPAQDPFAPARPLPPPATAGQVPDRPSEAARFRPPQDPFAAPRPAAPAGGTIDPALLATWYGKDGNVEFVLTIGAGGHYSLTTTARHEGQTLFSLGETGQMRARDGSWTWIRGDHSESEGTYRLLPDGWEMMGPAGTMRWSIAPQTAERDSGTAPPARVRR